MNRPTPPPPVRLIGLTGGIATGKSTVARLLAQRGAAVVDADSLAREVVGPGTEALAVVAAEFGPGVLSAAGELDREALATVVFADPARRRRLEAITHPRILQLMGERLATALATTAPLVVAEVPLLIEGGHAGLFEGVLLAWVSPATQLQRLISRDGLDPAAARARMAAQLPIDEKRGRATWVIDNDGLPSATEAQVAAWWKHTVQG